jgi:hypothetical protein
VHSGIETWPKARSPASIQAGASQTLFPTPSQTRKGAGEVIDQRHVGRDGRRMAATSNIAETQIGSGRGCGRSDRANSRAHPGATPRNSRPKPGTEFPKSLSAKHPNFMGISWARPRAHQAKILICMVLPDRIELSTSPLPRECSTTELRQQALRPYHRPRRHTSTRRGP